MTIMAGLGHRTAQAPEHRWQIFMRAQTGSTPGYNPETDCRAVVGKSREGRRSPHELPSGQSGQVHEFKGVRGVGHLLASVNHAG